MNVFNLMNMIMGGQQAAAAGLNLASNFGATTAAGASSSDGDDDVGAPKNVTDLLNMLRTFGLDRINAACPEIILK